MMRRFGWVVHEAAVCSIPGVRLCIYGLAGFILHQKFADLRQMVLASDVGEKPIVADAMQAGEHHLELAEA
jgi:2-polyprenyl-3-methyl-5-hydroxy-6-metoxy-1,4-benzoquinol methylase